MSHNTKYKEKITDVDLFCRNAEALGYKVVIEEMMHKMYGNNQIKGVASILIEGWGIPIVINKEGDIFYDHFGSKSGSMEKFHSLVMGYNEELVMENVPMDLVHNYYTEELENGDKEITLEYE